MRHDIRKMKRDHVHCCREHHVVAVDVNQKALYTMQDLANHRILNLANQIQPLQAKVMWCSGSMCRCGG